MFSIYSEAPFEPWSPPRTLAAASVGITGLAAAPYRDGVIAVWTEADTEGGLFIATVDEADTGPALRIVSGKRAPAHPTVAADRDRFSAFWTVRDGPYRRVEGVISPEISETMDIRHLSDKGRRAANPKTAIANGCIGVTWQEITGDFSSILATCLTESTPPPDVQLLTQDAECSAAVPDIAVAPDGFWVAWHTDRDTTSGPELVRSIELLHLSNTGTISKPVGALPPVERRGSSEDQGFEFPVLTCTNDGRLVILGRGSQSLRRWDLGTEGWSSFHQFDREGWQCRGRPRSAVATQTGIWTAVREKGTAAVYRLPIDIGVSGPPVLQPAPEIPKIYLKTVPDKRRNLIFGGYRVLFGDIHQHTAQSDGTGTLEETFFRARARYGDRVVAVTDHESFLGKRTFDGEWRDICRIADEFYDAGAFVTLKGFEWTGKMHPGPGHKVVYLPASGGPMLSRDDPKTDSSAGLIREARTLGALVIPHHVGWTGADMAHHAPDVQTCWEVVSCHGAYERPEDPVIGTRGDDKEGQFIADALDLNLRFGLVGGSDGHGLSDHHGVSRKQDSHRTGLTGFLSHEVTREGILECLRKRRCFATSGAKIALWFEVDGRPMGEELISASEVPFRLSAVGTDSISRLCIVTNGGQEIPLAFDGLTADAHGTLPPPPDNGFSYYFVRLSQQDGETAWSSPIWLDPPSPA